MKQPASVDNLTYPNKLSVHTSSNGVVDCEVFRGQIIFVV